MEYLLEKFKFTHKQDKYKFLNKEITNSLLNQNSSFLEILMEPSFQEYIDFSYDRYKNFEFAFLSKNNDVFLKTVDWLEYKNLLNNIPTDNVNNCVLSSTINYYNGDTKLSQLLNNPILKSKIDLSYSSYAILLNLSNMKNGKVIDLIVKNFSTEILNNEDKISKIMKHNKKDEFKSYLFFKCYGTELKEKDSTNKTKVKI